MLNTAEIEIRRLEKIGVFAETRSMRDKIDVMRSAITRLDNSRGFSLNVSWNDL